VVESEIFKKKYPRKVSTAPFLVIDGFIDFLLPSMASGSSGAITGIANFAPKSCMKLWNLCQMCEGNPSSNTYREAQKLQNLISAADGVAIKIGIPGMKMLLDRLYRFGRNPRRPLLPMSMQKGDVVMDHPDLKAILDFERSL